MIDNISPHELTSNFNNHHQSFNMQQNLTSMHSDQMQVKDTQNSLDYVRRTFKNLKIER